MDADNLYPADGSYYLPREPKDQRIARKKEDAKILESINVIKDIIDRLQNKILFYESVYSIPDDVKADPTQFLIMHNANEIVARSLQAEKEYLESLIPESKR